MTWGWWDQQWLLEHCQKICKRSFQQMKSTDHTESKRGNQLKASVNCFTVNISGFLMLLICRTFQIFGCCKFAKHFLCFGAVNSTVSLLKKFPCRWALILIFKISYNSKDFAVYSTWKKLLNSICCWNFFVFTQYFWNF